MKRVNPLLATSIFLLGSMTASLSSADTIGVYVGAGIWQSDFTGDIGVDSIGLNDLGVDEEDANFFYVALEHPVPVIPNIRLQSMDLSYEQTSVISETFTFDEQTFTVSDTVYSDFDLSHTDVTFYYELLDNWVSFDLGITARMFDGYAYAQSVTSPAIEERVDLDVTLPLVYAKVQFDLPFSGFYVNAGGNIITYDSHAITDLSAAVGYLSDGLVLEFGIEVGIRTFSVELDDLDEELNADLELSGPYATATIHF